MNLSALSNPVLVWLGWTAVVFGAGLGIWGLRGRRLSRPACRRCLHPLERALDPVGSTCSECGTPIKSIKDAITIRRRHLVGSFELVLACAGMFLALGNARQTALLKLVTPRQWVTMTQKTAGATVRILEPVWDDDFGSRVEVIVGGKLAYQTDILHPSVGSVSVQDGNGSQVEFLWIRSDSGGSGGYSDTYLYKVGAAPGESSFLPVAVLQNGLFQAGSADGKVLWTQPDITYRYLWTSGAGSPVPTLEAELTPSGQLAFRDPPPGSGPSPAELSAIKSRVGSLAVDQSAHEQVVAATLGGFFGLVYSGRGTEAWAFFRECYEHGISRVEADPLFQSVRRPREAWERDILDTMAKSPFWSEVLRINGGSLRPLGSE